ncbi:MAG: cytochrome P450 [Sphingosinicella sp.]
MTAATPFVPPHPPRGEGPVAVWRGFFGERANIAVHGWSELAFDSWYLRRNVFGIRVHIPLHPDMVQRVLLDNAANYVKPRLVLKLLAPTIGRGLLTSDGSLWREQRRIVAANFTPAAIEGLIPNFARAAGEAAAGWSDGGTLDMAAQSTATTMRVIADTLFAGDPRLANEQAMAHIAAALEGVSEARLQVLLGLPRIPWSLRGLRARRGQRFLRRTLTDVVRDRLAEGGEDFLGQMIQALHDKFEPGEALALAVDNAATFYLAGHETTANALTWTLFLLSEQPQWQEVAAAEARAALAGGIGAELPERLPTLRMILEESMRLYPPVPRFDREAVAADRLGEAEVEPGDIVSIWPWIIHRHYRLWDEGDAFIPERFAPDAAGAERHRFQYLPFGGGPRHCVGARFATAEALTVLACWLAEWRFAPMPGREVKVSGMVTLRPQGGLPLKIERRA